MASHQEALEGDTPTTDLLITVGDAVGVTDPGSNKHPGRGLPINHRGVQDPDQAPQALFEAGILGGEGQQ
jgi:hypothetical protein